jgi:peptidyl-prolyl cis-trans isomerase SurA
MSNASRVFRTSILYVATACMAVTLSAQAPKKSKSPKGAKAAPSLESKVLATVGPEQVLYADVDRAFRKNMNRRDTRLADVPRDTALEFLRLYTNYRLKVLNAKERGIDKDSTVKADIAANRKLLSETFYFDKMVADARVAELMERRTRELEIGIILAAVTNPTTRQLDTLASLAKAEKIMADLRGGSDFEQVARELSDDKETGAKGGRLPFITGGSMIKTVEDEAYALKDGAFSSAPVVSRFGYFIVKVFRSQPRQLVRARHILVSTSGERDSASAERFADSLLLVLKNAGGSADVFAELARKFSDDKASAEKGGDLGSLYSRSGGLEANSTRLVPAFEDAMFSLKDGQVSGKVRTLFGIHIIRRDSTKIPDAALERDNAKRVYRRLYYEEDKRRLMDSLRTAWNWGWNESVLTRTFNAIDTTKNTTDTSWYKSLDPALRAQVLYRMGATSFTVGDMADSLRRRLDMRGFTLNRAGFDRAVNKMTDPMLMEKATADLEKRFPEFASLMQEFNDGILLFKVEEQEVWSKLRFDTADARVFFDTTKTSFMTPVRYALSEIHVTKDSLAKALRSRIDAGEDIGTLAEQFTERAGMRDKRGDHGALDPAKSKLAAAVRDMGVKPGAISGPFAFEQGHSIVKLSAIEQPRRKTFDEALPELAPVYQDALQKRLQETWLSGVRTRFPVVVNMKSIDEIYPKKR